MTMEDLRKSLVSLKPWRFKLGNKLSLLLPIWLFLSACSLFQVRQERKELPVQEVTYQARESDELRKKIIVLPFLDQDLNRSQKVADVARKVVVEELLGSRQFVIVDNSDIPQDVRSFVNEKQEFDMVAMSRMAANLGVSAVVEGKILSIRASRAGDPIGVFRKMRAKVEVEVQIRVFGAKTGREIYTTVRRAVEESETTRVGEDSGSDAGLSEDPGLIRAGVRRAFSETVAGIVKSIEKLSWEGRIALVSGDKIFINAGRLSGIQVGDILKITEDGQEVFDPESGSFLGLAPGRMKGTVEIMSYYGKDGAVGVIHSGSGFKENDRVELY